MIEEEEYQQLLHEKKINIIRIKEARNKLHKAYVIKNKKLLLITDICMVLIILFNMGALLITNIIVVKNNLMQNKTITFMEANPVNAKRFEFVKHPDVNNIFYIFLIQAYVWTFLIGAYIYGRLTVINDNEYMIICTLVLLALVITSSDFINNLGYFIGKLIWI